MRKMKVTLFLVISLCIAYSESFDVEEIVEKAAKAVTERKGEAFRKGQTFSRKKNTPMSRHMNERNEILAESVRILSQDTGLDQETAMSKIMAADFDRHCSRHRHRFGRPGGFGHHQATVVSFDDICTNPSISCDFTSIYRTIDGTCNNLNNPLWGSAGVPFKRYLPPHYHSRSEGTPKGGIEFNTNTLGKRKKREIQGEDRHYHYHSYDDYCPATWTPRLPNARHVSATFHPDVNVNAADATHMVPQWGQFLDHDITLTPETEVEHCCTEPTQNGCFPINILGSDRFYSSVSQTCLEFSRSVAFCEGNTRWREQFNGITAFIDGSNIYGSDDENALELRSSGGKLASSFMGSYELLPQINNSFVSGDIRAQEMPGLAAMHTLFIREHNRIVDNLRGTNDEDLYQRARRVVIAEMQNIVYSEYLPVVLGSNAMRYYNLNIPTGTLRTIYRGHVDPTIANSFATAAYRFGHSMIQGVIQMINAQTNALHTSFRLRDHFFNLNNYFVDSGRGVQRLLLGLINQPAQEHDRFVTEDVTNFLFPEDGASFGSDLVARNIQRGRDHGLPGYNDWRVRCGMKRICSWNYRPHNIAQDNWNLLKTLYQHPNDIDLFVAGLAEIPVDGGLTGKTFNCIKSMQFKELMDGDRYFFTHGGQVGSFSNAQLLNLKSRTLADVICDNTEITTTRNNVFKRSSAMKKCQDANPLDFSLF